MADLQLVADFQPGLASHVQDDGLSAHVRHQAGYLDFAGRQAAGLTTQLGCSQIYRLEYSFTENRLGKVAAAHIDKTAASTTAPAACAQQRSAGPLGLSISRNCRQNLAGAGINQPGADAAHSFR